jgi:hypothetical protein
MYPLCGWLEHLLLPHVVSPSTFHLGQGIILFLASSSSGTPCCCLHFSCSAGSWFHLPVTVRANDALLCSVLACWVTRFFGSAVILVAIQAFSPTNLSTLEFLNISSLASLYTSALSWSSLLFFQCLQLQLVTPLQICCRL